MIVLSGRAKRLSSGLLDVGGTHSFLVFVPSSFSDWRSERASWCIVSTADHASTATTAC